jgi:predicted nucleic acid-binding protein
MNLRKKSTREEFERALAQCKSEDFDGHTEFHRLSKRLLPHGPALASWLAETRRRFAPATEELTEPVLIRWKELLADLKKQKRTMTCEDSLIAATVLFRGHSLATHNKRHFEPAGVDVIDPLA